MRIKLLSLLTLMGCDLISFSMEQGLIKATASRPANIKHSVWCNVMDEATGNTEMIKLKSKQPVQAACLKIRRIFGEKCYPCKLTIKGKERKTYGFLPKNLIEGTCVVVKRFSSNEFEQICAKVENKRYTIDLDKQYKVQEVINILAKIDEQSTKCLKVLYGQVALPNNCDMPFAESITQIIAYKSPFEALILSVKYYYEEEVLASEKRLTVNYSLIEHIEEFIERMRKDMKLPLPFSESHCSVYLTGNCGEKNMTLKPWKQFHHYRGELAKYQVDFNTLVAHVRVESGKEMDTL